MARTRALSVTLFILSVVALCAFINSTSIAQLTETSALNGWKRVVNLETNQYLMWRDFAYTSLLPAIVPVSSSARPLVMNALILLLGTALVTRVLLLSARVNPMWGWGLAVVPTLLTLSITGGDSLLVSALAWVPLLTLCLSATLLVSHAGMLRNALPLVIITALVSTVCARSANHFAALAALLALFVARYLHGEDAFRLRDSRSLGALAVAFVPALIVLVNIPSAPFPDYPPLAHVVPDDGLVGIIRPLIGVDYSIQVIDRGVVKSAFSAVSLALTLITLAAIVLGARGLAPLALLLSIVASLDTLLPESLAQIAPIAALGRILPWGTTVAYTPLLVAVATWLISLTLVSSTRVLVSLPLLFALVGAIGAFSPAFQPTAPEVSVVASTGEVSPSTAVVRHMARALSATSPQDLKRPLLDGYIPSFEPLTKFNASITSPLGETAELALRVSDGDPRTRWATGRGVQNGDESVEILFSRPTQVSGIELDTGTFTADFPRGLSVLGTNSAGEATRCHAHFPSWQGSVARTPKGFPYYTGQHEVRIIFPEPCVLTKIAIKQTGVATFDWSIAEVRIAP